MEDLQWEPCSPGWVGRYNACGPAVRRAVIMPCEIDRFHEHCTGHQHLMNQGQPVLWTDAIQGQADRLATEDGERAAWNLEQGEPF